MGLKVIDGTPTAIAEYLRKVEEDISQCPHCHCMTKSVINKCSDKKIMVCGKCAGIKSKEAEEQ